MGVIFRKFLLVWLCLLVVTSGFLLYQRRLPSQAYWALVVTNSNSTQEQIYRVMTADGTTQFQLSRFIGNFLQWSPDGNTLFFQGERGLYASNRYGNDVQLVASGNSDVYYINAVQMSLSPDQQWYLVKMPETRNISRLYRVSTDGRQSHNITQSSGLNITSAEWLDESTIRYIVESRNSEIETFLVEADGLSSPKIVTPPSTRFHSPYDDSFLFKDVNGKWYRQNPAADPYLIDLLPDDYEILAWVEGDWLLVATNLTQQEALTLYAIHPDGTDKKPIFKALGFGNNLHIFLGDDPRYVYLAVTSLSTGALYRLDIENNFEQTTVIPQYNAGFLRQAIAPGLLSASQGADGFIWQDRNSDNLSYFYTSLDGRHTRHLFSTPSTANVLQASISPDGEWLWVSYLDTTPLQRIQRYVVRIAIEDGSVYQIDGNEPELKALSSLIDLKSDAWILNLLGLLGLIIVMGWQWRYAIGGKPSRV